MGYPREIYRQAFDLLEQRRGESRAELERRRTEIHRGLPRIAEIERKMAATAAASIYAVAAGTDDVAEAVSRLGQENLALQREREQLLTASGYPPNYLAEAHHCPNCADTGYIGAERCRCLEALLRQMAFARMNDSADLTRCGFDNFELSFYSAEPFTGAPVAPRKHMGDVLAYCKQYAARFSRESESLLMMGRTGQGKTHLSLAIAREVTSRGFGVIYIPFQRLIDRLEMGKFSHDPARKERYLEDLGGVMDCDLLVLDDLGAEFITPFTTATAYNIINTRLVEQRPTIVNTNLELAAMEQQYSQRIASRLGFGYKVLAFYGEDIRYLKRAGRKNGAASDRSELLGN